MKENKNLYFYYGFLFVVNLLLGFRYHGEASTMMRLAFLVLVIVPTFDKVRLQPAVVTLFLISSTAGYVEGLMPSQLYWYAVMTIVAVAISISKHQSVGIVPPLLIVLLIYVTLINILNGLSVERISYSILIVIAYCMLIREKNEQVLSLFSLVFALISLSLSIMFVMASPSEIANYGYSGLERVNAFADPNYFGCTLGMGALTSVIEFYRPSRKKMSLRLFFLVVAIFSFVILILNASRGGILAFALAVAAIILFSKAKRIGKIITIVVLAGLITFLYENDYFALLEYRIMNDTGGGSSRTAIWMYKLNFFFNNTDIIHSLFGYGHNGGLSIGAAVFGYGGGKVLGFHNDLVAFLVDYGIVGFLIFISFIHYLYKQAKRNKVQGMFCYSVLLFLSVHIMTLEPYTSGDLSIWVFSLYALLLAQSNNKHENSLDSKRYIS